MNRNEELVAAGARVAMPGEYQSLSNLRRLLLAVDVALCVIAVVVLWGRPDVPLVDVESALAERFPSARPDAFDGVNRLAHAPFTVLTIFWVSLVVAFVIGRCYRPLVALITGPVVASGMLVPFMDFSDPAWFTIGAVIAIGCFVGLLVSIAWSFVIALRGRQLTNRST